MKLVALYTVWNGLELLDGSISKIENQVDKIIIGWQWLSNKGEPSFEIESFLERYADNPKIELVEFVPSLKLSTKQNELNKHNALLEIAKMYGYSHFLISATDHYYEPEQFAQAKTFIEANDLTVTASMMYTYYKHPTWRMDPPETYYIPFICKLNDDTVFKMSRQYPVVVDPSCKVFPLVNFHAFSVDELMMHHFSMVRVDIENKFNNAAASIRWKPEDVNRFISEYQNAKVGDSISYFGGRRIVDINKL